MLQRKTSLCLKDANDLTDVDVRLKFFTLRIGNLPRNAPSYAMTQWGELRKYTGIPAKGPLDERQSIKLRHGYYAAVSYVDAMVGKLLAELDRHGLQENTIVVLWGDHGWKLGERWGWRKHTNFEIVLRSGETARNRTKREQSNFTITSKMPRKMSTSPVSRRRLLRSFTHR